MDRAPTPWAWVAAYAVAPAAYAILLFSGSAAAGAVAYFGLASIGAAFLLADQWRPRLNSFGLDRAPRLADVAWAVGGFLVLGGLWPLIETAFEATGSSMFWPRFLETGTSAMVLVAAVVLAPLAEELWFRGYGFAVLQERGVGPVTRVLATSAAFGAVHLYGGPGFAAYIFLWSLGVGAIYLRRGTLWAPIILHLMNNVWAHLLRPVLFDA